MLLSGSLGPNDRVVLVLLALTELGAGYFDSGARCLESAALECRAFSGEVRVRVLALAFAGNITGDHYAGSATAGGDGVEVGAGAGKVGTAHVLDLVLDVVGNESFGFIAVLFECRFVTLFDIGDRDGDRSSLLVGVLERYCCCFTDLEFGSGFGDLG